MNNNNNYDKELLEDIFSLIKKYFDENLNNDSPIKINPNKSPSELKNIIDFNISKEGINNNQLLDLIKLYLDNSVKTMHKQFFNQLFQGFNLPSFLGEIITSASNTSMYTYEVAPVATLIEIELIKKICNIVGFKNGDGTFVPGGSYANLVAVLCARNNFNSKIKSEGILESNNNLVILISDQAHYSFKKAANITGIGVDNVVCVESDSDGKMIPEKLEEKIIDLKKINKIPFFINATAGTTVKGAIDPINEISNIAKKYNIWLHVDGALGGLIILSHKNKFLLNGINTVNSFAINPHKLMGVHLSTSIIIVNNKESLKNACSTDHGNYLFHESSDENYDLGQKSLQCGRKVDSLKLWLSWKHYGDDGYENIINNLFEVAKYAENKVKSTNYLELISPIQTFIICFRFKPQDDNYSESFINDYNIQLHNELLKSGLSMMNRAIVDEKVIFRLAIVNNKITKKDIDILFNNLEKVKLIYDR